MASGAWKLLAVHQSLVGGRVVREIGIACSNALELVFVPGCLPRPRPASTLSGIRMTLLGQQGECLI